MSKLWVEASRSDIKPGAKLRVKYTNERSKPLIYGTVTTDPVTMRRGDLAFSMELGDDMPPLRVRHGDYTGTVVCVEVERDKRIKAYTAALRSGYKARERVTMVTLVGGPLEGATVPLTACHTPWLTLAITCKGQTGRYQSGRWVPA